jgi:hypothetical protein
MDRELFQVEDGRAKREILRRLDSAVFLRAATMASAYSLVQTLCVLEFYGLLHFEIGGCIRQKGEAGSVGFSEAVYEIDEGISALPGMNLNNLQDLAKLLFDRLYESSMTNPNFQASHLSLQ